MNQAELLQSISKYLARFSEQIEILNANNEFHLNVHAENLLVNTLNIVYDLNLINLNQSESGNYSAIDLLDKNPDKRIAFQITSTSSIDKVKDCIQKFYRHGIYKEVSVLYVYILTSKQSSYSKESIQKKIDEEVDLLEKNKLIASKADVDFQFNVNLKIIDKIDLYKKINLDNNLEKIIALERFIKQQFGVIDARDSLSDYYQSLKNMFYETVMDDDRGMTLDQIYTEPSFSVGYSAINKDDARLKNRAKKKFYHADSRYKVQEFVEDILKGENYLFLNKVYRLILILGYPGQGKSSFCKKLLNTYILRNRTNEKSIYYFSLRNIRQVREFIYNPMSVLYDEACTITEQNLNKSEFNKSLLILDGLDELYMRESLKLDEIDRLCIEFVRIVEKFPELKIVLTSRYGYVDDEKLTKEPILLIHLSPFNFDLQVEWLSKYRVYHSETWLTDTKLKMLNFENKYIHIRELLVQPLLLHMVASIKNEIDEHTNRAKIYSQLFNELIDRKYAKEGQIEILRNVKKEDLRELIREIAFAIFQTGNEYITKKQLFKHSATQTFLKLLPEENFRDSIKGIMIAFYFKEVEKAVKNEFDEDRSNYAIEFLHKSLREYMTAEKIFNSISLIFLEKRINGRYIIDDSKSALSVISAVFGKQDISFELKYHLRQIIENSEDFNREELTDRLCLFFKDFLLTDFLVEYRMNPGAYPMDSSLRCFYGFWYFISCLGLKKNYLTSPFVKERTAEYLRFLSMSDAHDISEFDFSHQDLSTENLRKIDFVNCTFEKTILSGCNFNGVKFHSCIIMDANFNDAYIDAVSFSFCSITGCSFKESYFEETDFTNSTLKNCDFALAEINIVDFYEYTDLLMDSDKLKMIVSGCSFKEAVVDKYSLENIKKWYPEIDEGSIIQMNEDKEQKTNDGSDNKSKSEKKPPKDYKRLLYEFDEE